MMVRPVRQLQGLVKLIRWQERRGICQNRGLNSVGKKGLETRVLVSQYSGEGDSLNEN